MRSLHESVTKEKSGEISLIEAGNEANNELLASFLTKSSGVSTIFTRHLIRAKVSTYIFELLPFMIEAYARDVDSGILPIFAWCLRA